MTNSHRTHFDLSTVDTNLYTQSTCNNLYYQQLPKFLINLETKPQRLQAFYKQLGTDIPNLNVVKAVNGSTLSDQDKAKLFNLTKMRKSYRLDFTNGQLGCTLSHFKVYQQVLDDPTIKDQDFVLVMEDDCKFVSNFGEKLGQSLEQLQDPQYHNIGLVILMYTETNVFFNIYDITKQISSKHRFPTEKMKHVNKTNVQFLNSLDLYWSCRTKYKPALDFFYKDLVVDNNPTYTSQIAQAKLAQLHYSPNHQIFYPIMRMRPNSSACYLIRKSLIRHILNSHPQPWWLADDFKKLIPYSRILLASPTLACESDHSVDSSVANPIQKIKIYHTPDEVRTFMFKTFPWLVTSLTSKRKTVRSMSKLCQRLFGLYY